ncbi:hypothetical protein NIES4103_08060 [Nostoc sp. NIES-4103]|nr:hypothetical protein NIES4103_08060 [Nostoc sp. NIES-4103]
MQNQESAKRIFIRIYLERARIAVDNPCPPYCNDYYQTVYFISASPLAQDFPNTIFESSEEA